MRYHITPTRAARIKRQRVTSIGEDMEKLELVNCWKECKMVQPLWRAVWQVLRKWNTELPYDPVIPLLGIYLQRIARRNSEICTSMFTAKLLTIDERWKQPKCAVTDEWLNRMWHILTIEYYSALKRKGILTLAAACMNCADIMLSEIRQSQRDKYCRIPLIWGL